MKRQPTEIVALVLHGLSVILAALMWLRASQVLEVLKALGVALAAPTQLLSDFHLPAVLVVGLAVTIALALSVRSAATLVSTISVVVAVVCLAAFWLALRIPFMKPY